MARPLRLEFPGAVYHITSRGNGGNDIFLDDHDRQQFLEILADTEYADTEYKRGQSKIKSCPKASENVESA